MFTHRLPLILLALATLGAPALAQPEPRRSLQASQALWVVRDALLSPQSIAQVVEDAHHAGITDLLVQVRGRGDAYYTSKLAPAADPLKDARRLYPGFDPLAQVITAARPHGIRVHAWLNVYLVAGERPKDPSHILLRRPDWAAVDSRGRPFTHLPPGALAAEFTEGIYLDAGNAGVVNHFVEVVTELAEGYALDGVHLDYVRYPYLDSGYSDPMRRSFEARFDIDPLELAWNREGLEQERGAAGLAELQSQWNRFRADKVTALVRQTRGALRMTRPGVILSAAVKPDPEEALDRYGQDWVAWVHDGLVDIVAPMMYSKSTRHVSNQMAEALKHIPPDRMWAGIAVYNQSLASAGAKIKAAQEAGLGGVSIFSYNSMPNGGRGLVQLLGVR